MNKSKITDICLNVEMHYWTENTYTYLYSILLQSIFKHTFFQIQYADYRMQSLRMETENVPNKWKEHTKY